MAAVNFRRLRADEFEAWAAEHIRGYAEGMIAFADMSREQSELKAARDVAAVLPQGVATEGTHLWVVEDEGGRSVGSSSSVYGVAAPGSSTSRSTKPSGAAGSDGR